MSKHSTKNNYENLIQWIESIKVKKLIKVTTYENIKS